MQITKETPETLNLLFLPAAKILLHMLFLIKALKSHMKILNPAGKSCGKVQCWLVVRFNVAVLRFLLDS